MATIGIGHQANLPSRLSVDSQYVVAFADCGTLSSKIIGQPVTFATSFRREECIRLSAPYAQLMVRRP
jgi:hypothetical protein